MSKIHAILILFLAGILALFAQPNRITERIAGSRRVFLKGSVHPKAVAENDQGPVDPGLTLPHITLMLQPSADQKTALEQFLAQQQDPSSPNYHHWLTPEQYADRFGISPSDISQIVAWLKSQNLNLVAVARGRDWVVVSGTAAAVQNAFGTSIHQYLVNGELHFANTSDPSIPAALEGVVASIHGLNNFRLKPASRPRGAAPRPGQPQYDNAGLCGVHCLGPDDVATIYNIQPLLAKGTNGSGQKIVVAGQTQIRLSDIEQFRTFFGLPANDPQVILVPGEVDPGISTLGDLSEADLELELSGAVARNATILYVYAGDVTTAEQYAIDQNLAPVLSSSYGDCEQAFAASDISFIQQMAQQANAQGITWLGAAGDAGATDCSGDGISNLNNVAAVDIPAALPEVTGIGGTEFSEGSGNYWSATNSSTNASALSYIPEMAWNDTALDGSPSSGGGGASTLFPKPSWQTGTGVPSDGARDVPDISISASADHDGYLIFTSDSTVCGSPRRGAAPMCEAVFGGTSVGAPLFSGLTALLNQSMVNSSLQASAGLGNINPTLYGLARTAPAAFHDVTAGNNIINVTCTSRERDCTAGPVGFNAGVGYDLATGLGSVDADALFTAWLAASGAHTTPPSNGTPSISGITNAASYDQTYAPGMILTIFGSQLAPAAQAANTVPLPATMEGVTATINGVGAPLWYVSPGQINLQIPYETPAGTAVTLIVNNNGQTATTSFTPALAAPGIFTDAQSAPVPFTTAARGDVITMYVTGVGAVTPGVLDGAAPANGTPVTSLPQPVQGTVVTVGGVSAPIQFAGIPWGLVGVIQINYQIPTGAALGAQPVVVRVGSVSSKAATLTITQ